MEFFIVLLAIFGVLFIVAFAFALFFAVRIFFRLWNDWTLDSKR